MTRALVFLIVMAAAASASARNGQIYFELAPSWGFFNTDDVFIEIDGTEPPVSFVPQLKVGLNLFGWAGAELDVAAVYWDLTQADRGGGGYVGGVFRLTPLEGLSYYFKDDLMMPGIGTEDVNWHDRWFDLGLYFGGGYHLIGEDIGYEGGYLKYGFDLKLYITPSFAIGFDFPFRQSLYKPFRYTNYNQSTGVCTDGAASELLVRRDDDLSACTGAPPSSMLFAPAFTISGGFDFGI
jgi:hypothetical protein